MARDEDEVAFKKLRGETSDQTQKFYTGFLDKQIESISVMKESRKLCETY